MAQKALILIDFQNEWTDPESEFFAGDLTPVIGRANRLIDHCRSKGFRIIFVKHVEEGSDEAFSEDSPNSEIMPAMHRKDDDIVVVKHKVSAFYKTDLEEQLEGIEEIVFSGILTNLCVRSAVHDAYDREFDITVIEDCCVSFDKKTQKFTFKDIMSTRPEIRFVLLDEYISGK